MILLIGLGNPSDKYKNTRHNAGFMALEKFRAADAENFSTWKESKKFQAIIADSSDKKIKLALPQTFMNNSGEAVVALAKFYKIPLKNIWVVHDDLDLALGRIKIQSDRSAAGHNGVKSIIAKLGSQKFLRFRIGIQPLSLTQKPSEKLVLEKFPLAEKALLNQGLEKTVAAIFECLQNGLEKTMTKFNA